MMCADDDQPGIHHVRQVTQRTRWVTSQSTQCVGHVHPGEYSRNMFGEFRVELSFPQLGQVRVERHRHDGAVRMLLDRVTPQIHVGTHQLASEVRGESARLQNNSVWLAEFDRDNDDRSRYL